jgi:hypothetical protein
MSPRDWNNSAHPKNEEKLAGQLTAIRPNVMHAARPLFLHAVLSTPEDPLVSPQKGVFFLCKEGITLLVG